MHVPVSSNLYNTSRSEADADLHSASEEYAARFESETGAWMLQTQERITLEQLDRESITVLDVGGGHGQIAIPLMKAHRSVTVLGSSPGCSSRLQGFIDNGELSFKVGNLIDIPFGERSFDSVVCFRYISHCTQWRTLVKEMCRVSRHSVILDFPVWRSINSLVPLFFRFKRKVEGNTRTFEIFSLRQIRREFEKHGFMLDCADKQFVLPMALHRLLNNRALSEKMEGALGSIGMRRLFGSPVIAKFVRRQ